MSLDRRKFEQAVLYFVHECQNEHLGRVKLMKLLYYLDFDHLERHHRSVTGDDYIHLKHGPVPKSAREILDSMDGGTLCIEHVDVGAENQQHRFIPMVSYDLSVFSVEELETLRAVANRWRDTSSIGIEDASHRETPWLSTLDNQDVPKVTAFHRQPARRPSPETLDAMFRSIVSSLAAEGVTLDEEEARRWFNRAEERFFAPKSAQ